MGKIETELAAEAQAPAVTVGCPALRGLVTSVAEGAERRERGEAAASEVIDPARRALSTSAWACPSPVAAERRCGNCSNWSSTWQADPNIPHILRNHSLWRKPSRANANTRGGSAMCARIRLLASERARHPEYRQRREGHEARSRRMVACSTSGGKKYYSTGNLLRFHTGERHDNRTDARGRRPHSHPPERCDCR